MRLANLHQLGNAVLLQAALACLIPLTTWGQNLVLNPGFEHPAKGVSPGTTVTYTDACMGGTTAAAEWSAWINTCPGDISTTLVPSTAPNGGSYMIHVVTNGIDNGIWYCCFASQPLTTSSVWVYVNSGCVGMGTGDYANTSPMDEMTCVVGHWIQFKAPNGITPATEFIVYSVIDGSADFYVDNARVVAAP